MLTGQDEVMVDDLSGLALEYQRDYGSASGDLNVSDLVNNPAANGVWRVFGLRLAEEVSDGLFAEVGVSRNDRPDLLLVAKD